jgi:inhibitor of cysteine peptidase
MTHIAVSKQAKGEAVNFLPKILAGLCAALLGFCLAFGAGVGNADGKKQKSLRAGTSYVLELEGNPSTGYRWRLNQGSSENLAIVKVEDLGYGEAKSSGKKLLGAPAPYRFRITGLSPGFAKLAFEYVQPWVGKPAKTEQHEVHVSD